MTVQRKKKRKSWYDVLIEKVGLEEARRIAREKANARNAADREGQRARSRAYYARTREKWRAYEREKYAKSREAEKERHRVRRVESPLEYFARQAVLIATRKGILIRPERCVQCGEVGRIQAHHADYTKPLEVEWLCSICHGLRHRVSEEGSGVV